MTELGKQLMNVMSMRVADRISSLIRTEERSGKPNPRADVYRVAVTVAAPPPPAPGTDPVPLGRDFKLSLIDKKASEPVHYVIRAWPIIKQVVLFIRGVAPKLDVPPLPVESQNTAPAVVAEDRRKFVQTYVNAALQHGIVSNLKEFVDLIGLTEYQTLHAHDAAPSASTASAMPKSSEFADNASLAGSPLRQAAVAPASKAAPTAMSTQPAQATQQPTTASLQQSLQECFRVLDVGGAGYLTPEDMKGFFAVVLEVTPKSKPLVSKLVKDSNAMAANEFANVIQHLARDAAPMSNIASVVGKWVSEYQASVFCEVYAALGGQLVSASGASDEEKREYDASELRTLQFVLRVSGVRNITEAEIEKEEGLSLPVSNDDFCRLMSLLTSILPFDDTIRALQKSARNDHGKFLQLVCSHAATSGSTKRAQLKALSDLIAECGGGPRRLGKCGNCEALEQRVRVVKVRVTELENENDSLRGKLAELEDQLAVKEIDFANAASQATVVLALEEETATLRDRCEEWEARYNALEQRLKLLEEGEDQSQPSVRASEKPITIIECNPLHLGSTTAPLVDLPGAVTLPIGTMRPNQLHFDIFLTGLSGCEYFSCRDGSSRRSVAFVIENGRVSMPSADSKSAPSLALPHQRWLRCLIVFDWNRHTFSLAINSVVLWPQVHMRDPRADAVSVLDIYPRREVLVCYANLHFDE